MGIISILLMEIQSHLPGKQRTLFQLYHATHIEHRHSLAKEGDRCAYCAFTINYVCAVVQRTLFRRKELHRGPPWVFNHCVGHDPIDRGPTAGGKEFQVGKKSGFHQSPCTRSQKVACHFREALTPHVQPIQSKDLAWPELQNSWFIVHLKKSDRLTFNIYVKSSKFYLQYQGKQF